MAAKNRPMTNSVQGALDAARAAEKPLKCPFELRSEAEEETFKRVLASRERASWSDNDLHLAGMYAQSCALEREVFDEICTNGFTIINERGTRVANPQVGIRRDLVATIINLAKSLGLSASQKGLTEADQRKRNAADRIAQGAITKPSEDNLI